MKPSAHVAHVGGAGDHALSGPHTVCVGAVGDLRAAHVVLPQGVQRHVRRVLRLRPGDAGLRFRRLKSVFSKNDQFPPEFRNR